MLTSEIAMHDATCAARDKVNGLRGSSFEKPRVPKNEYNQQLFMFLTKC